MYFPGMNAFLAKPLRFDTLAEAMGVAVEATQKSIVAPPHQSLVVQEEKAEEKKDLQCVMNHLLK